MIIYKAYKYRMYPTNEQIVKLNNFIGSSRFIYNYYLNKKDTLYKENKTNYSLKEMKKDLVKLYSEYKWLKDIDSTILRTTLEDLDKSYINFYNKQTNHPRYKKKGNKDSYRTNCIRSSYKDKKYENIQIRYNEMKIPKIGKVKIKGYRNMIFNKKIINATIGKESNRYYVSVCVEEEIMPKEFVLRNVVGLDLGVKTLVTTSDGIKYDKMDFIKRIEKRIKGLQKGLSRTKLGSKNREKLKQKISRAYLKVRNMRKYYIHSITSQIVKENDIIVIEKLKIKQMIQEKHLSKELSNASFHEILRQIKYKSKWLNKKVYEVDTYYPSSKICNHCGIKNNINSLSIRKWTCIECNNENDRDINASINILEEGLIKYYKEQYN